MYVRQSGESFSVQEALADDRVEGHPKRQSVQCYYGIPLFGTSGQMLGTVCHFDSLPIHVTEEIASTLDELSPLITAAAFEARNEP